MVCEARRAFFAINHLRRCRYSPPPGCIPNFCAIPRARKRRRGRRVFDDSSLLRISLPPPLPPLLFLPPLIPSPVANKNSANAPGVREIRKGCARLDAGDLYVRKCRERGDSSSLSRDISVKHRDREISSDRPNTDYDVPRIFNFCRRVTPPVAGALPGIVDRFSYGCWRVLSEVSRADSSPRGSPDRT